MGATVSKKVQEASSTTMDKMGMVYTGSQKPTGKPQQRNQIGNQQRTIQQTKPKKQTQQHQKRQQQNKTGKPQHQQTGQQQRNKTGKPHHQQKGQQQPNLKDLGTIADIYLQSLTTPIIMNNREHLKRYNSEHVQKGMEALRKLKIMDSTNQEVRDILEKYKNSLERFIHATKPGNKDLQHLFSEIYGVPPKQQTRQTQQKKQTQQTQQTMDDHELIMQANNNLHKLYNFCDKKKIKIVTPAMVKETLVGIKALNQLKNRRGKSKYESLFTKYEKYIKCFIDECSKEQEIFSTGENQRELTELKNKFETLYDYRIL